MFYRSSSKFCENPKHSDFCVFLSLLLYHLFALIIRQVAINTYRDTWHDDANQLCHKLHYIMLLLSWLRSWNVLIIISLPYIYVPDSVNSAGFRRIRFILGFEFDQRSGLEFNFRRFFVHKCQYIFEALTGIIFRSDKLCAIDDLKGCMINGNNEHHLNLLSRNILNVILACF